MAEKTFTMKRVPADQVSGLLAEYAIDKPAKISKIDNHDGTFDLEIVFSENPAQQTSRPFR